MYRFSLLFYQFHCGRRLQPVSFRLHNLFWFWYLFRMFSRVVLNGAHDAHAFFFFSIFLSPCTKLYMGSICTFWAVSGKCVQKYSIFLKKLWYIYKMEYYSVIKRNTFETVLMKGMNIVSQKEKNNYCILMHVYGI